jgi:hypothetical protein
MDLDWQVILLTSPPGWETLLPTGYTRNWQVYANGRLFAFHALRHQFISNLAAAGVHPKEAQILARHSTITLTMDGYTHIGLADVAGALDKLPPLLSRTKPQALRATGTDSASRDKPNLTTPENIKKMLYPRQGSNLRPTV